MAGETGGRRWIDPYIADRARHGNLHPWWAGNREPLWLCFLALVDVYLDPEGSGLPMPSIHPPRVKAPFWIIADKFLEHPGRQGFVVANSLAGAQNAMNKRLQRLVRDARNVPNGSQLEPTRPLVAGNGLAQTGRGGVTAERQPRCPSNRDAGFFMTCSPVLEPGRRDTSPASGHGGAELVDGHTGQPDQFASVPGASAR